MPLKLNAMIQFFRFIHIEIAVINSYFAPQINKSNVMKSRFFLLNLFVLLFIINCSLYSQIYSNIHKVKYTSAMNYLDYSSLEPGRWADCRMDLTPGDNTKHSDEEKIINSFELKKLLEAVDDVLLLDIRTEHEFSGDKKPINGAFLFPINKLEDKINELDELKNQEIIVYCLCGIRSGIGNKALDKKGFNSYNLEGELIVWYGRIIRVEFC